MENYIDGFVLPVPRKYLDEYKNASRKIAEIWKEHGAIAYCEFIGDDLFLEGTKSFVEVVEVKEDEVIIFGWVLFPSKEIRDSANIKVPEDSRMAKLVAPLLDTKKLIFDGSRMVYGGFQPLV
ncbi:DUF1428 family protein [Oceanihabitans sediminis]|uniref:DUF1428 domain-containing protein n=1 Tax=Oceanihabitans sediminis TaxID=1812012 RepID=UPI000930C76D|nr:DUF1428 family protein [Oceanihabitans sediminis]MDX1279212.1 DUF1428 family protein [Oceanihabitans sediminis]